MQSRLTKLVIAFGAIAFATPTLVPANSTEWSAPAGGHASVESSVGSPWITATGVSENARRLLSRLEDSRAHGLTPARYGVEGLRETLGTLERTWLRAWFAEYVANDDEARHVVGAAALARGFADDLGRAFERFATDLGKGVVDARATQRRLYRNVPSPDIAALSAALADGTLDVDAALDRVVQGHADYRRLVTRMRGLLAERDRGVARTDVPDTGSSWFGDRHDEAASIKRRLIETGDLAPGTALTPTFDAPLVLAIERFRARHGLPFATGLDVRTRRAMNMTVDEAIEQAALSLERWRWMPRDLGERHVWVNLPDYRMQLVNGTQRIVDLPVVIGKTRHATPSFSEDMTYLSLNPTWTVPRSIAHAELLPLEQRRPGRLRARGFEFLERVDGGYRRVPYDSVGPELLAKRPFPYVLRQRGGPGNALGDMKFMLPNPYSIYLHDTPTKRHFELTDRAYSHGCIRVSNPAHLLDVLLRVDGKSPETVRSLLALKSTRNVTLATPVPTHLVYFTFGVDEDGIDQFRPDVYRHDPALSDALRAANTLLTELAPAAPVRRASIE